MDRKEGCVDLIMVLIALGLVSTLVSLALGLGVMAQGGALDMKYSTRFMFARVGSQAITVAFLVLALILANI